MKRLLSYGIVTINKEGERVKLKSNMSKALFIMLFLFPFFVGGYYVFYTAAIGILLSALLLISVFKNKKINYSASFTFFVIAFMSVMYFLTKFWAVDKSMAIHGFIKFFTAFLFAVSLIQIDRDEQKTLLCSVPLTAVIMTVFTYLMGFTAFGKNRFYDNIGDLHGTFEYANAFAIYLLVGIIIALFSDIKLPFKIVAFIVCAFGIYKSNSRAVWLVSAFMVVAVALFYIFKKIDKTKRKISVALLGVLFATIVFIIFYRFGIVEKVWNYVNTDGSFNERLLYYTDALRYIVKHPFGKGAYAFYFAQSEFQSAYYYAIDVHCDFLEYAIEIGIVPAVLFIVVIIKQLFSKQVPDLQKFVILAIALHSLVDYDLQFTSILFVLLLCFDYSNVKTKEVTSKLIPSVVALALTVLYGVIGLSAFCNYIGDHQKSVYYYKNTPSLIILMQSTNDKQSGYVLAQEILKRNDSVYEPNNVMANIYSADNKYGKAVKQMELVIKKDPRTMQHYRDYIDLLVKAIKYYDERGETKKSQNCKDKIACVDDMISDLKAHTSKRGILYGRKQDFEIGKEYKKIIKKYS